MSLTHIYYPWGLLYMCIIMGVHIVLWWLILVLLTIPLPPPSPLITLFHDLSDQWHRYKQTGHVTTCTRVSSKPRDLTWPISFCLFLRVYVNYGSTLPKKVALSPLINVCFSFSIFVCFFHKCIWSIMQENSHVERFYYTDTDTHHT